MASERGIATISTSTDLVWATGVGTWTAMTLLQKEGTRIGPGEPLTSEEITDQEVLDAIRFPIAIQRDLGGAGSITDGTAFWIKVDWLSGTSQLFGGTNGFKARNVPGEARSPRSGRMFSTLIGECYGAAEADVMKAAP